MLFKSSTFSNDPYTIARNNKFVSVNASLEIDLTGQCASETVGNLQWSGTGGSLRRYRRADVPGREIHHCNAFHLSATDADGKEVLHSKIVPSCAGRRGHTSRNDTDYVVTEYGIAWLRGLNIRERLRPWSKLPTRTSGTG